MASPYAETAKSYPTPAAPRAVNPSAFGTLEDALEACANVRSRTERIIDRMCGAVPEQIGKDGAEVGPNGLLDIATRQAVAIRDHAHRISAALDRLESQLP